MEVDYGESMLNDEENEIDIDIANQLDEIGAQIARLKEELAKEKEAKHQILMEIKKELDRRKKWEEERHIAERTKAEINTTSQIPGPGPPTTGRVENIIRNGMGGAATASNISFPCPFIFPLSFTRRPGSALLVQKPGGFQKNLQETLKSQIEYAVLGALRNQPVKRKEEQFLEHQSKCIKLVNYSQHLTSI